MFRFLKAHGFDPGPTQRPLAAGLIAGAVGTLPATAILLASGALAVEAEILRLSEAATLAIGVAVMALAGGLYGRLFGRGANDARGGWLFGMAYGFLLWTAGAVMVLPLVSGGRAPAGSAAAAIFIAILAWGTTMGALFPHIHRRIHVGVSHADMLTRARLGPGAASPRGAPRSVR